MIEIMSFNVKVAQKAVKRNIIMLIEIIRDLIKIWEQHHVYSALIVFSGFVIQQATTIIIFNQKFPLQRLHLTR